MIGEFDFYLSPRWTMEKVLGSGGFGVVYSVFDRQRSERVAMKMLRQYDPSALNRFKREFRSLVDLLHPNLVSLYELFSEDKVCYFTMELVEGTNLLTFLRGEPQESLESAGSDSSSDSFDALDIGTKTKHLPRNRVSIHTSPRNARELRPVFRQLAEGLVALHYEEKLHRDIKPTNILIDRDGRVVVLDFGLVTDLVQDKTNRNVEGTFRYMSPEQADGSELSEASDWYSFGVVLYEALTGAVPGNSYGTFDKYLQDPIPARKLVPETPADLDELCMRLLAREPDQRPTGDQVLAALGALPKRYRRPRSPVLVGRGRQLGFLERAFERAQTGRMVTRHVHGSSGIGKSALVQQFLRELAQSTDALIFRARCYQRESVPYKALDGLIDAIARHLRRMRSSDAERLVPTSIGALAHIFPVLQTVGAVANTPHGRSRPADLQELRRAATTALEQLLANLSATRTVVIFIDDLQWGDLDSAVLLAELLQARSRMAVLLITAFRTEDRKVSSCLQALLSSTSVTAHVRPIKVRALAEDSAATIIRRFLYEINAHDRLDRAILREAAGNPFFIQELVSFIAESDIEEVPDTLTFESVLRARIERLPEPARRLLITIAFAGQPISELPAFRAAGVEGQGSAAVAILTSTKLIRVVGNDREQFVTFHDRIREAVLAHLQPEERHKAHSRLAIVLEAAGEASADTLAAHYESAEEWSKAASCAAVAARNAAASLAFQKAAHLYEQAMKWRLLAAGNVYVSSDDEGRGLKAGLAEALANQGKGPEAGEAYIAACENAPPHQKLEWQRRAAEQFLHSGHTDRGIEILRSVLSVVDIQLPKKSALLIPRLLLLQMRGRLRLLLLGMRSRLGRSGWHERSAAQIPPSTLLRIDACSAAATGLALVDIAWGTMIQTSHLLLALRAGEPYRISRALAMEGGYSSSGGRRAQRRAESILAMAHELAIRIDQPHAVGLSLVMSAASSWNGGRWLESYERSREAREMLRERCSGVTWELDTAKIFEVDSLRWMGRWRQMASVLPAMVTDARERGDLYAETILQMHCGSCAALAKDRPDLAGDGLRIVDDWSKSGFHVQHLIEIHNLVEIALYRGDGKAAMAYVSRRWADLRRSLLLEVQTFRVQMLSLRARAVLCSAAGKRTDTDRCALINAVLRDAKAIRREGVAWGTPVECMLRACGAAILRRTSDSIALFRRTEEASEETNMILHAAVAKRCYGLLMGGTKGHAIIAEANAQIAAQDVVNVERLAAVIAPGISGG